MSSRRRGHPVDLTEARWVLITPTPSHLPVAAIQAEVEAWDPTICPVNWDTHGCGLPRGHEGDHRCIGVAGCGDEVDPDGCDASGFKWTLWGAGVEQSRG